MPRCLHVASLLMPVQFHRQFVPCLSCGLGDHELDFARMIWLRNKHLKISEQQTKVVCIVALISVYVIVVLSLAWLFTEELCSFNS